MPPNLDRKTRRKRQTRLTFDSVNRSSSPASTMSPANVRYELPGKRQAPASSARLAAGGSESEDVLSSAKKDIFGTNSSATKRNGRLPFKPLPTPVKSSQPQPKADLTGDIFDVPDDDHPVLTHITRQSHKPATFMRPTSVLKGKKKIPYGFDGMADSCEESEVEITHTAPSKKSERNPKRSTPSKAIEIDTDSDEAGAQSSKPESTNSKSGSARRTPSLGKALRSKPVAKRTVTISSDEDEVILPKHPIKVKTPSKPSQSIIPSRFNLRSSSTNGKKDDSDDDDDDDDDNDPIISSPRRSQNPIYRQADGDSGEDDILSSRPTRRRQTAAESAKEDEDPIKSPLKRSRLVVESDEDESDEDPIQSPLKRSRPNVDLDDSDEELVSPAKRQRVVRLAGKSDLEFSNGSPKTAQSEAPKSSARQQKLRRHRTEKEKKLELLRRRRDGEKIEELTDSGSGEEDDEESEDELQVLEEFDDEEVEEPVPKSRKLQKKKSARDDEDEEIDDENFVVEDDEDAPIGIPVSIPLEFTHAAHKPMKDHFKDAVEWMVHKKINPAFPKDDEVYVQAFRKLDDECSGLAKSKFSSTQWTKAFTTAIYARPFFESGQLQFGEGFDIDSGTQKCDACNHRNHKPSKWVRFFGKPYDKFTLEPLDRESDSDSDSGDSSDDSEDEPRSESSINSKGQAVPKDTTTWNCGSVCYQNAEQSHTLVHWKFHLNDWVIGALEGEGELTPEKLQQRENLTVKKRTKYANRLVDRWDHEGQIKTLYGDFKRQLNTARELKAQGRGGWK